MKGIILTLALAALSIAIINGLQSENGISDNTFYLLCYKRDLKCIEAEKEMLKAKDELVQQGKYAMIDASIIPNIKVIECIVGSNQDLCKKLGHNLHELMPPRIKIAAPLQESNKKEPIIYPFTSPLKSEFIVRKLMKLTIPVSVIPYKGTNISSIASDLS